MTTEELIAECAKRGIKVELPKQNDLFAVLISYDRGLGTEYKKLPSIKADTPAEAQVLAIQEALKYTTELGKETVLKEVKIIPDDRV